MSDTLARKLNNAKEITRIYDVRTQQPKYDEEWLTSQRLNAYSRQEISDFSQSNNKTDWSSLTHEATRQSVEIHMVKEDLKQLKGMAPKRNVHRAAHEPHMIVYHGGRSIVP